MIKPKSICVDCKERSPGCHIKCESYQTFKKKNEEYKNFVKKQREKDYASFNPNSPNSLNTKLWGSK